ncbi:MAG: AzlC family ABC transporter permease [Anaerolineae bacterium]|nr:AzlC family ABC transporter permease [Anaerolineae bacterium]RIK16864.1 MAG: branched-chain amino acid ABC transporter permease [Anaerolineae bacterium]
MPSPRNEFLAGVRGEVPILLGVAPFGMIFGALAVSAGVPALLAQAMSLVIFAGSAQFIAAELIAVGTPTVVLLLTTLTVNLRHLLYSASLAPHVQALPLRWKLLLAYLMTDEAYAVTVVHYADAGTPSANKHWFFLGAGVALWGVWQTTTALGIFLGARIPPEWSLDFALPLTFIGIVVPALRDRPQVGAALAAGVVAVIAAAWPYKLGLMAAALVGILVGIALERLGSGSGKLSLDQETSG